MTDYMDYEPEYDERIVEIARVAKVVKGGRRFAFRVTVVVGDNRGQVGIGVGKANAVQDAMRKAVERGRKNMHKIALYDTTIPHEVIGKIGGAKVLLKPASRGTGVIAGGGVRAVLEAAGISDILTKSLGSSNLLNVVKATMLALDQLKDPQAEAARRGKALADVTPFWDRRKHA
ncbi:MAG: 30S ribosomal protein S5 [Anaerolineae bacterium]|jgi:small subunit ribosomal protein S5|nr:MAG: 30S ribosomal protein S5 [Anaerolineae bacterium]